MDKQKFEQRLQEIKVQLDCGELDEIPLDARPKMMNFNPEKDSYVVVSYSRKDFDKVYLFLAHLYDEGYRFWYDAGMLGTDRWISEFRNQYENANCLGSITFFSDNYISNSTKEELSVMFRDGRYVKQNMFVSLVPLADVNINDVVGKALLSNRVDAECVGEIVPVLKELISEEKARTIHRYRSAEDIPDLVRVFDQIFSVRDDEDVTLWNQEDFAISDGVLHKYIGQDEEVVVPSCVTHIADGAFRKCSTMQRIVVPDSVVAVGEEAFAQCGSLRAVTLSANLTSLGALAFAGCEALESIDLPEGLTEIARETFYGCLSLKTISLPQELKCIESAAFSDCAALESIDLPEGLTEMAAKTFCGCRALKTISLPQGITRIGSMAFARCMALESIDLPEGLTAIEHAAFFECQKLKTVSFPKGITYIGRDAFSCCEALESLDFPEGLTAIDVSAFRRCTSLVNISIPDGVTQIRYGAFEQCRSLRRVVLPHGIKRVENRAFRGCSALETVVVPATVTFVHAEAFAECPSLTNLQYEGTAEQWKKVVRNHDDENRRLPPRKKP